MIHWAAVAAAQEEPCPGQLRLSEVQEVLVAVSQALGALDGDRASHLLDEVHELTRCLAEVVDPETLGTYAANRSVVSFYEQDFEEARRWASLAVVTTGSATAGAVSGPERWWADYGAVEPEAVSAAGAVAPPPGGLVVLDGRALTAPSAASATPHLLQVVDRHHRVSSSRWIDGTSFPADVLGEGGADTPPRWWTEPPGVSVVQGPPPAPAGDPPGEVVFDGVVTTEGCPFGPDPQDVRARTGKVAIGDLVFPLRRDEDLAAFRSVLRTCGEFRAARRFVKWSTQRGTFSPRKELRDAWVEALTTPEPRRNRKKGPADQAPPG